MKTRTHRVRLKYLIPLAVLLATVFSVARAAPGDLDTTFAGSGKLKIGFNYGQDYGRASLIQPDGKIVVAGYAPNAAVPQMIICRYNADGTLDPTFSGDGKFIAAFGSLSEAYSIVQQPDGKLIVVGQSNQNFAAARFNPDGSIDTTFGNNGIVTTHIANADYALSAAIQPDGKIVLAGDSNHFQTPFQNPKMTLVRYTQNGVLDTSFDSDGIVTLTLSAAWSRFHAVAVQPDGKIVALGVNGFNSRLTVVRFLNDGSLDTSFNGSGMATNNSFGVSEANGLVIQPDGKILAAAQTGGNFAAVRFNPNGTIDENFGQGGTVSTPVSFNTVQVSSMALQTDGKILVAGYTWVGERDFLLVRYNPNGSPDTSFDGDGIVSTPLGSTNDEAYSVNVQSDGKIVVAGNTSASGNSDVAVVRYNTNGSFDAQFGTGGVVKTDVANEISTAKAVAITPDNKIAVAGYSCDQIRIPHFTVVRLNESGSFDTSFGSGGRVVTRIGAGSSQAQSIAIQADGKTVVAGYSVNAADRYFFTVVRYNIDGSLDTTFDGDGIITTDIAAGNHIATSVMIQPDGKIAVAGNYKYNSGESAFLVVRYNADGSLDTTFDGDGIAFKRIGNNNNVVNAAALDLNGNIILGGHSFNNGRADFTLLRFSPNGSVDAGFGNNGVVITPVETQSSNLYSLAVQSDNKIVAGGVYLLNFSGDTGFALTRYNADGSLDATFDGDGIVTSNFGTREDNIYSIRLQPDGKIIAGGIHSTSFGVDFAVARYNANGSPDSGWGTNGVVFADFTSGLETLSAVAIDRFGRIVAVGESNRLMTAARFKGDVEVTVTATISGRVVNASGRGIANARITLSDSTGAIRIVSTNPFGYYRFAAVAAGREYFLSVSSKQIYTFTPSVLTVNLFEDYTQANFTGNMSPAVSLQ